MLEKYLANVKYVSDPNEGHTYAADTIGQAFSHVFGNIAGSGVNANDAVKAADSSWATNG